MGERTLEEESRDLIYKEITQNENFVEDLFKTYKTSKKVVEDGSLILRVKDAKPIIISTSLIGKYISKNCNEIKEECEYHFFKLFLTNLIGECVSMNIDIEKALEDENEFQQVK